MAKLINAGVVSGPFAATGDGRRAMRIDWDGVTVLVQGSVDGPAVPENEATELSRFPVVVEGLRDKVDELEAEIAALKAKLPPKEPAKMLGVGCVRFADGGIYLLNSADEGWSAFGLRFRTWDDLFREYAVTVGDPHTDEWGQYWPTLPSKQETER